MFENRNGLSSVVAASVQTRVVPLEREVHFVRVDVARQPDVPVDRLGEEQLQIALRQSLEKPRDLGRGEIVRTLPQQLVESGLIALDQLIAVALREMVVGVHVEPPEQLLFPRRQRLRADRFDVDERHQAEHLQALFGADERREVLDDLRILGVATKRDQRHAQVMLDQEQHRLARLADELQTIDDVPGHPLAFERVVVVAPFADVVQQQRQHEQLRLAQRRRSRCGSAAGTAASVCAIRSRLRIVSSVCSSTVYL